MEWIKISLWVALIILIVIGDIKSFLRGILLLCMLTIISLNKKLFLNSDMSFVVIMLVISSLAMFITVKIKFPENND